MRPVCGDCCPTALSAFEDGVVVLSADDDIVLLALVELLADVVVTTIEAVFVAALAVLVVETKIK